MAQPTDNAPVPRGVRITSTNGQLTWEGTEQVVSADTIRWEIKLREQDIRAKSEVRTDRIRERAIVALMTFIVGAQLLGLVAMAGVAAHDFEASFAMQALTATLVTASGALGFLLRWAFARGR
jgi:hypothetical protein